MTVGRMVRLSVVRLFCRSHCILPASAPSSPTKTRSSSSVLKAVSSHTITRNADSMYAASRSFDDRSMFPLLDIQVNYC